MLVRRERAMTAVAITLDVAFHATRDATVGAAEIAERLGQARRGIEPVLQALSRAGILESVRGPRGGYRLGRPRRDLRLADVVRAALDDGGAGAADAPVGRLQALVVAPLWAEMEALCERHLAGLTVEDLLRRAAAAGIRRPVAEPLNFAI
jgi:Rrf2 family transcriptional regulator, iron-sulfur cluster assembly transcription factor